MFPLSTGRTLAAGACPRVLVVAADAHDVVRVGAPLLLHAVAAGASTAVCTVVPGPDRGAALRRACRRLWVARVDVLDGPDTEALRRAMAAFAPDVVVVVDGPTTLHERLGRATAALAGGACVHRLSAPDGTTGAGLRIRLATDEHRWTWRRALAELDPGAVRDDLEEHLPPHVVLERVDVVAVLGQTRPRSRAPLRLVPPPAVRSA